MPPTTYPLDSRGMAGSIRALPAQCRQALESTDGLTVPESYRDARAICVSGMGGSALAAHVVAGLESAHLRVPLVISNQYSLPGWVGASTLVVLSSYSGGTAETLATAEQACARRAMVLGITTGDPLLALLNGHRLPHYRIVPDHNPSGQPRLALGYALFGLLGLLWPTGLIPDRRDRAPAAIDRLATLAAELDPDSGVSPVPAIVDALRGKAVHVVASEHLQGNAHILANQLNENAKNQASWHPLPELNHHLLEGLTYPEPLQAQTAFLMLHSGRYLTQNRARYVATEAILRDAGITVAGLNPPAGLEPLDEALWMIAAGSWLSFLLAMANGVDPSPIPYVDRLKEELKSQGY
ncbi:MAG TPA: SIS domain-containing protein [bacterium]|nr:SIS domain-containing protein [bacterium]